MSEPCKMFQTPFTTKECGKPATVGWQSEVNPSQLIPTCDECIRITGMKRAYLKKLPVSPETPSDRK